MELDLAGVRCPMTYAKVKLLLEDMAPGEVLEVLLDVGEPARNVPASVARDGHEVLSLEHVERTERFRLVVRKRERAGAGT